MSLDIRWDAKSMSGIKSVFIHLLRIPQEQINVMATCEHFEQKLTLNTSK